MSRLSELVARLSARAIVRETLGDDDEAELEHQAAAALREAEQLLREIRDEYGPTDNRTLLGQRIRAMIG